MRAVIVNRFVHHVPFADLAFVMTNDAVDVGFQNAQKRIACAAARAFNLLRQSADPTRHLAMPGKSMTANLHAVRRRISHELIALGKAKATTARFRRIELHFVFSDHNVEIRLVRRFINRCITAKTVVEPFRVQNGADKTSTRSGKFAQSTVCSKSIRSTKKSRSQNGRFPKVHFSHHLILFKFLSLKVMIKLFWKFDFS